MKYKLTKQMKKTAGLNNLEEHSREPKVLLDMSLVNNVQTDYPFDSALINAVKENIATDSFPYENNVITMFKPNKFDWAEVRAVYNRHYVFSKKTGNLLYRILEVIAIKVTYVEHKTLYMNDVGTVYEGFAGSKYSTGERFDYEI